MEKEKAKLKISLFFIFLIMFLIGGVAHVALYGVDFADCICQIYYGMMVMVWALTIQKRIIDKRERNILVSVACLLLAAFLMQALRYKLVPDGKNTLMHYVWYSYYVSLISVPLLIFFSSLYISIPRGERINRKWYLLCVPGALLMLTVLSNDLHGLMFKFFQKSNGSGEGYSHGIAYYVYCAWIVLLLLGALINVSRSCRRYLARKMTWFPFCVMIVGILLLILAMFDLPKLNGIAIWRFIEAAAFLVIGMTEACIQIGLIPANTGYEQIFVLTEKKIKISDLFGETLYASKSGETDFAETDDFRIMEKDIHGGKVSWGVDISALNRLNGEISEATRSIEIRNEFLRNDINLKEERSRIDTRNALYDRIAFIVRNQVDEINEILSHKSDNDTDAVLAKIAVLGAYIKRRSNMELIDEKTDILLIDELCTAVTESADYLSLCGIDAAVSMSSHAYIPKDYMTNSYEFFEYVCEKYLFKIKHMLVNIACRDGGFFFRMVVDSDEILVDENWNKDNLKKCGGRISIDKDDELMLTLSIREGGAK